MSEGFSGAGAGAGYALSGYYDMRDRRLTAKERDEDRTRELRRRDVMDPIDEREAELLLEEMERNGVLQRYMAGKQYGQRAADVKMSSLERQDEFEGYSHGIRAPHRTLQTQVEGAELGLRESKETSPYRMNAARRGDELGGYAVEQARAQHPNLLADAEDYGLLREPRREAVRSQLGYQQSTYDAQGAAQDQWRNFNDLQSQLQNALAIASEMRDPAAIVSAYNNLINDGQTVQIRMYDEDPKGVQPPNRRKRKISVLTPRSVDKFGPQGLVYDDFDAFLRDTNQVFQNYLQQVQPSMSSMMPPTPYGRSGLGLPGIGGRSGYGRTGYGGTAEIQNIEYYKSALRDTVAGQGLSDGDLTMLAAKMAKNKDAMAPEIAARESYLDLVQAMIKAEQARFREPNLEQIQSDAAMIIDRTFGSGVNWLGGADQMGAGGQSGQGGYDWRQRMSQLVGQPD